MTCRKENFSNVTKGTSSSEMHILLDFCTSNIYVNFLTLDDLMIYVRSSEENDVSSKSSLPHLDLHLLSRDSDLPPKYLGIFYNMQLPKPSAFNSINRAKRVGWAGLAVSHL